jgi:hypothetical protein
MIVIIPLVIMVAIAGWMLRPRKQAARARITAILAVAVPVFLLTVAAVIFQLWHNAAGGTWVSDMTNILAMASAGLIVAAALTAAGFGIARKSEIARGLGFGICISVVVFVAEWCLLEWLGGV